MIFPLSISLKQKPFWGICFILIAFIIGFISPTQAQETKVPLNSTSYFGNTEKAKELYENQKKELRENLPLKIPAPPLITFIADFHGRIKNFLGGLFYPAVYIGITATAIFQFMLAQQFRHRYPEMALGYFLWLGLVLFNNITQSNIQGMPILVGFCLIPSVWQIFQFAQFSFLKTVAINIGLAFMLFAFVSARSEVSQNILLALWTIYIFIIYTRIVTYITHAAQISSWHGLTGLIPLFGFPTLLILAIRSRQMMESISTSFVNIILKLLHEGKSRLEIRNYALASRVRLSFFEHNFGIAFRLFEEGKQSVSPLLYKLYRRIVLSLLGFFIILSIGSGIMSTTLVWGYFQEWQQDNTQKMFLELVAKDNDLLIQQFIMDGKIILEPECPITWEDCYPLYIAVANDSHNVLTVLFQNGVSLGKKSPEGKTIIEIAEEIGTKDIIRLLKTEEFQRRNQP